jgi:hypothetical protein
LGISPPVAISFLRFSLCRYHFTHLLSLLENVFKSNIAPEAFSYAIPTVVPGKIVAGYGSLLIPCRPVVTDSCLTKGELWFESDVSYTADADITTHLAKRSTMPLSIEAHAFINSILDFDLLAIITLPSAIIKVSCKDNGRDIK